MSGIRKDAFIHTLRVILSAYEIVSKLISHMQKRSLVKMGIDFSLLAGAKIHKDFCESVMCTFEDIDNENHFLDRLNRADAAFYKDTRMISAISLVREELFLSLLGQRGLSDEELKKIAIDALNYITEKDYKYDFLRFFCMQFFRSPAIHNVEKKVIEEIKSDVKELKDLNTNFYVNSLMILFAEQMAQNINVNLSSWIEIYNNKTSIPFITSDTPIVNLTGDKFEDRNELYYPISPKIAIKLVCSPINEIECNNKVIDIQGEALVKSLNKNIFDKAYKEVYSNEPNIDSMV
ncbi:hypothetical protein CIY_27180 [Butyrivibrio fibrisolvens 16/4]|nr:hypothetical protein CIY_27180 [Butyrivibrio fibrisolvens 16/4]